MTPSAGDDVAGAHHEIRLRLLLSRPASNPDDHRRNHGYLMRTSGMWSLSPAYDLNPVPKIECVREVQAAMADRHKVAKEPRIPARTLGTSRLRAKIR
jgi:hypothetical protein